MTDSNFTPFQSVSDLCGRLVYFSRLPSIHPDFPFPPGWYFVDSLVISHSGQIDIGVEFEPDCVEYFSANDVEFTKVGACSADLMAA